MRKLPACGCVRIGLVAVFLSGCFSYRQADPATLQEGRNVRVQLTRQGFAALPEIPGQPGPRLAGVLVSNGGEQLRLRVPLPAQSPLPGETIAQEVNIPARDVVSFEVRQFNLGRSGVVIGGGLLTAAALYASFEKGNPANPDDGSPPEEEGFVSRLLRSLQFTIRF